MCAAAMRHSAAQLRGGQRGRPLQPSPYLSAQRHQPPRSTAPGQASTSGPPLSEAQLTAQLADLQAALSREGDDAQAAAVALAEQLRASGLLRAFGAAAQVPKRAYSLAELRLNNIYTEKFLAPSDETLNGVRNVAQVGEEVLAEAAGERGLPWPLGPVLEPPPATL